jgi:hypothetical protein
LNVLLGAGGEALGYDLYFTAKPIDDLYRQLDTAYYVLMQAA